ncbi:MAG: transglycosylase SLT domain-containing protein, partial [Pseudomonadales bacterium]
FYRARTRLDDYVLRPYLDYHELRSRISSATPEIINNFRTQYAQLPVAEIVYYRWLKRLGGQRKWTTFLANYESSDDAELRCYYLRALYATGEETAALADVSDLWLTPRSQPKACDPLFDIWISRGGLSESMVWKRLELALDADSRTLARYLQRFFESPGIKPWAQSYYSVHVTPSTIVRTSRFRTDNEYSREVIAHGLKRLAERDPTAASKAWLGYQDSHSFGPARTEAIEMALLLGHANQGTFPAHHLELAHAPAESMALAAVIHQRWTDVTHWVERLPENRRDARRWQYWLARSLAESTLNSKRAQLTYSALAEKRDYYGFLAAEEIERPVQMNHKHPDTNSFKINQLYRIPAVLRATELFAVGDRVNARREWYRLAPTLSVQEKATAATLAGSIGWTSQGIRTANDPALQDFLELRFPLAYQDDFHRVSHITTVPETFLLAIARQESLFDPRARSPANARGLMQLIHPTAERVARRVGLSAPKIGDLYDPSLNIELGGHHLAGLMNRYGQRRPLAAAAYNAGERRVDGWIKNVSGQYMDVWIESIPYRETRSYVKNVLAFAQVYGHRQGSPTPMLEAHETRIP